jgi:hypothetical protein
MECPLNRRTIVNLACVKCHLPPNEVNRQWRTERDEERQCVCVCVLVLIERLTERSPILTIIKAANSRDTCARKAGSRILSLMLRAHASFTGKRVGMDHNIEERSEKENSDRSIKRETHTMPGTPQMN